MIFNKEKIIDKVCEAAVGLICIFFGGLFLAVIYIILNGV